MAVQALAPRRGNFATATAVVAVAAGVCVLLATIVGSGAAHDHGATDEGVALHLRHVAMVVAMTLVMMGPFAVPLASAVSRTAVWWRARTAVAAAVLAYLSLWVVVAGALHVAGELLSVVATPAGAVGGLTALIVAEQLGRRRAGVLGACQATRPVREGSATRDAAAWGGLAAVRCIRACGLPMALMAVEPSVVSFVGVTALLWAERFGPRPRPRVLLAAGYLVVGLAQVTIVIVQR